jgi:peroxiredoxin
MKPWPRLSLTGGFALLVFLGLWFPPPARPATKEIKTLEIGAPAPEFDLPGVDGRRYQLKDFAGAKVLVIVFTCNHCPTAQAYEARLIQLANDYRARGVAVAAISPNDPQALRPDELGYTDVGDSFEEMKLRARERGFPFPYLYDGDTQAVALAYGALATPHVFIFDAARRLRYAGRVDNSDVKEVTSRDARNAIDALLAGGTVPVEKTRVFGCSTKWREKRDTVKAFMEKVAAEPVTLTPIDAAGAHELAANKTDRYRLVNVWATWCGPCVAELGDFAVMNWMYRRRPFELVTISLDGPPKQDAALAVLKEKHVSGTNYLFTGDDKDKFADALDKDWPGPLPHTILIAPGGKVVYRHTGAMDPQEIRKAIVDQIGRTYAK